MIPPIGNCGHVDGHQFRSSSCMCCFTFSMYEVLVSSTLKYAGANSYDVVVSLRLLLTMVTTCRSMTALLLHDPINAFTHCTYRQTYCTDCLQSRHWLPWKNLSNASLMMKTTRADASKAWHSGRATATRASDTLCCKVVHVLFAHRATPKNTTSFFH
jgi:hypothetical protein